MEDNREKDDDGGGGARATGPRQTCEKRRKYGGAPRERPWAREFESKGWSGGSGGYSAKETEEDGMTKGGQGGSGDTLTASPWGTQESGVGELQVGAWAGGSDGRKAPSTAVDEAGTRDRHVAGAREKNGGRRDNAGAVTSGVQGTKGGREASGVDPEPHGVGGGDVRPPWWGKNSGGGAPRSGRGSRFASGR